MATIDGQLTEDPETWDESLAVLVREGLFRPHGKVRASLGAPQELACEYTEMGRILMGRSPWPTATYKATQMTD
jgi:hypothetical protein